MADKYFVGESLRDRLRATIARVEGTPLPTVVTRIPTSYDQMPPSTGTQLKLAAFTGTSVWVRMQAREIYFFETDTASTSLLPIKRTENTATAVASMFSIPGVTTTVSMATALVTVAKMNGVWNVISAGGGA